MPDPPPRPGRRRRDRSRWPLVLLVVLVVVVLVAVAVAVAWWWPGGEPTTSGERVAACEREHDVTEQQVVRSGDQLLRRCAWPPPGAGTDGYHEISVTVDRGDARLVAYRFSAPCPRLGYRLADGSRLEEADAGQVVDATTGGPAELTPELLELVPELAPGTLVVLTVEDQPVDRVECVD